MEDEVYIQSKDEEINSDSEPMLQGKNVLLGVTGSIAQAIKTLSLLDYSKIELSKIYSN